MSQQINLYEARLRPRVLLLTGQRLALALAVVLLLGGSLAFVARRQADQAVSVTKKPPQIGGLGSNGLEFLVDNRFDQLKEFFPFLFEEM